MTLIYGIHAVSEALNARRISRLMRRGPRVDALVARARAADPIETLDRRALERIAREGVQGAAAELQPMPAYLLEELVREVAAAPRGARRPDPQNVGAIIRSADAAGADGLIRQARHAAPSTARRPRRCRRGQLLRIATVVNIARSRS
jgi:23S rRNA (guanosine2251-2'-O)-methyltransferase